MGRIFILFALIVTSVFAAPSEGVLFSIEVVAEQKNGIWAPGDTRVGDQVTLSKGADGLITMRTLEADHKMGPKSPPLDNSMKFEERWVRERFGKASLAGFDFDNQLAAAKETEWSLYKTHGNPHVVGGTTVEVFANYGGTRFHFVCKDLDVVLPYYARYNPELARLLALLEDLRVFKPLRYSFTI